MFCKILGKFSLHSHENIVLLLTWWLHHVTLEPFKINSGWNWYLKKINLWSQHGCIEYISNNLCILNLCIFVYLRLLRCFLFFIMGYLIFHWHMYYPLFTRQSINLASFLVECCCHVQHVCNTCYNPSHMIIIGARFCINRKICCCHFNETLRQQRSR